MNSILIKSEILAYLKEKKLEFTPNLDNLQLQAHSVDLRLGYSFMIAKQWMLTEKGREALTIDYLDNRDRFTHIQLEKGQFFDILPKESVVVSSLEQIKLPNDLMGILYPRSSVNRRGLSVDMSGIIDAGYEGHLLIPITNNTTSQNIRIFPGERFCQVVFQKLNEPVKVEVSRWHKKDIIVGRMSEKRKIEEKLISKGNLKDLKNKFPIEKIK